MDPLADLLALQSGVVSRRQIHECGHTPADLKRMLRRRELNRVHVGAFVEHSGEPTWLQRAWAAVLSSEPAALYGISAIRAAQGPGMRSHDEAGPIHVAVDRHRHVQPPPGVVVHRMLGLDQRVQWNLTPPRVRIEEAVLDVAATAGDRFGAVAVVGNAVQGRLTTAQRLLVPLAGRTRIAHRQVLESVIHDVAAGACSALERAYLRDVERAHGLRRARRQVRASAKGVVYRDVEYDGRVVIELDGRLDHTSPRDRDRDLDRDLDAAVAGRATARLGWGQVVGRPCVTARKVYRLLVACGVETGFTRCADCPPR